MSNWTYLSDEWEVMDGVIAAFGGVILGISVSLLYSTYGNLTGISGMVEKIVKGTSDGNKNWELYYLCGIYAASFVYIQLSNEKVLNTMPLPIWMYIVGGLCVGFGSRMGCGCTSGHGISGLARLSKRSFVGVGSFFAAALVVTNVVHGNNKYETSLNASWYQSNSVSGATLMVLSLIPPLCNISEKTLHVWFFGALFGLGLSVSGMVNNGIVLAFLNFNKAWNPALIFVLAFAVGTFGITFWLRESWKSKPLYADKHKLPEKTELDMRLIGGEILFGVGWGLAGICPGPMIATLSVPAFGTYFMPSLFVGIKLVEYVGSSSGSSSATKDTAKSDSIVVSADDMTSNA